MTKVKHDAGLHAVLRVRSVRERDSRLGLHQALAEQAGAQQALAGLHEAVAQSPALDQVGAGAFLALRQSVAGVSARLGEMSEEVSWRGTVADQARARHAADRSRERAVEMLLERRAAERAAERRRAEAKEADDLTSARFGRGDHR